MKLRLAAVAARRLEEHRLEEQRKAESGPVATLRKAMWDALQRGDVTEAMSCVQKIQAIRGSQPPSRQALVLIERINRRFAAHDVLREKDQTGPLEACPTMASRLVSCSA